MLKTVARARRRRQEAHGRPDSWLDKLDRMKDAVVLAVALLGLGALFAMESTNAERKLAEGEPLKGNSPAVLTCILAVSGSVLGWRRGKAAPAARISSTPTEHVLEQLPCGTMVMVSRNP